MPGCVHPSFHSFSSHSFILDRRNLKRALHLVNVVADSRYKLYEDFIGIGVAQSGGGSTRLVDYLEAVRKSVLCGVEGGGTSDLFKAVVK